MDFSTFRINILLTIPYALCIIAMIMLIIKKYKRKSELEAKYKKYYDEYQTAVSDIKEFMNSCERSYARVSGYETVDVRVGRYKRKIVLVDLLRPGEEKEKPKRRTDDTIRMRTNLIKYSLNEIPMNRVVEGILLYSYFLIDPTVEDICNLL